MVEGPATVARGAGEFTVSDGDHETSLREEDSDLPSLLAAFDADLRRGSWAFAEAPQDLSASARMQWERAQACLRMLEEAWPRQGRDASSAAQSSQQSQPGPASLPRSLGRFELRREVGRGGFGVVYHAYDPQLGRDVALKVPHSHVLANPELRSRFQREARSAAGLDHPNIVPVYEAGEIDATAYIALAYCPGITLHEWLRKRKASVAVSAIAEFMARLAKAVHYAHDQGIIHRDLKPANILLGKESSLGSTGSESSILSPDAAKITDFGLAKHLDDGNETRTGTIAGTPCYMAPEQTGQKGSAIGPATDVYALGAILYELLTGRAPFQGETVLDTLDQVRHQDPVSPSRLRRGIPRDLVTVCLTCLRKEPSRRYATALALAQDLDRFLNHQTIRARPTGVVERCAKWARRQPALATLIATIVLGTTLGFTFVVWQLRKTEAALDDAKKAHAETQAQSYLNQIALAHHELLANHVDQAEHLLEECPPPSRGWEWHYLKRLCQTDLFTLAAHPAETRALAYSPDGDLLASGSGTFLPGNDNGEVKVWDARTGKELQTLLRQVDTIFAVSFSPDSRLLATAGRDGKIVLWNPRSGERLHELNARGIVYDLAFSPDSRHLASVGMDVRIFDVESEKSVQLPKKHTSVVFSVAWSPDDRYLVSTDRNGEAHLWNPDKAEHVRLLAHVLDLRTSAFSPDGTQLVAGSWDGSILLWDMSNLDAPPIIRNANAGQIYDLAFGPDGRRVAFCARDGVRIWDMRTGAELHAFTGHNGVAISVAFSPVGSWLATGGVDGMVKIWDATLREEFRRFVETNAQSIGFSHEPDGRDVVVGSVDRWVKMWDAATAKTIVAVPNQTMPITAVAADCNGRWLAWISGGKSLRAWDRTAEKIAWSSSLDRGPITGLAYNKDGTRLAWGGVEGTIHVCEAATGQDIDVLGNPGSPVTGVAFDPTSDALASIDRAGTIRVWDVAARKAIAKWGGSSQELPTADALSESVSGPAAPRITRLAYSPDGKRLALATRLRPPEIWDTAAGRPALILDRAVDGADCAAFTADGRQFVAGLGAQLRIWNTAEQDRHERSRLAVERALAWHRLQAQQYRKERYWFGALWHLNQLIEEAAISDASLYWQRAEVLAELGNWQQALADNTKATELSSRGTFSWYDRACLALQLEDRATYRETCAEALQDSSSLEEPKTLNTIAWISLITSDSGGDPLRIVELAEKAVAIKPQTHAYLNTLGAAWYRAGRYADAITQLQRSIGAHESKQGICIDWLFLAMAHARLGEHEQARSWLDKALGAPEPAKWQERLEQRLLRQEAEQIVKNMIGDDNR